MHVYWWANWMMEAAATLIYPYETLKLRYLVIFVDK